MDTELTTEQREHLGLVRVSPEPLLSIIDDSGLLQDRGGKAGVGSDSVRSSGKRVRNDAGAEFCAHQKQLELVCNGEPRVAEGFVGDTKRV